MLTAGQREEFDRFGIVRLGGAIADADLKEIRDCVWARLAQRYHVSRDEPAGWKAIRATKIADLPESLSFDRVGGPIVCGALDLLLGSGNWQPPRRWSQILAAFPELRARWEVPHQAWHLDFPASRALAGNFAVRVFTCLEDLKPGGGGTVALAGSHRLVEVLLRRTSAKLHSADVRKLLIRSYPWIKALCSRKAKTDRTQMFMERGEVLDGVEARVAELTGAAGDVILMHPWLMHAAATNCADVPRLVLSTTVFRTGVTESDLYG
jgi:hypothetical protein